MVVVKERRQSLPSGFMEIARRIHGRKFPRGT